MTKRVLIIDDEAENLQIIINILKKNDSTYTIMKAPNGSIGLNLVEKNTPDIIITDWNMPVMDGIEFIKHIRASSLFSEIPIIMCTGVMLTSDDLKTALQAGASDFVRKPIDKIELIARTNSMLNLAKSQKIQKNQYKKLQLKTKEQEILNQKLFVNNLDIDTKNTELELQKKELLLQTTKIAEAHKDITDSIVYAKTIQKALLTSNELIDSYIEEYFIFYKPKDKVSGDFYYLNKMEQHIIIGIADCTGHGVPGGFLTMLGITYLHEIAKTEVIQTPGEALNLLRERFKRTFREFGSKNSNGLDIALCSIDTETNILQYAGAFNPLIIIRDNQLIEYKATRNPIGYYPTEEKFKNTEIKLFNNDTIYMFSDGFKDQLGGKHMKKLMSKRFKNLLLKIHGLPMKKQKQKLYDIFEHWKGNTKQTDDVLVFGMKFEC